MKCIVLAAGMALRLRPLTTQLPKCLLSVGDKTILDRTMECLLARGIDDIALVVGFEAERIRSYLRQHYGGRRFRFLLNPNFATTGNAYSLLLAKRFFLDGLESGRSKEDLLILDSDIIFHPGILDLLLSEREADAIAVRVEGAHDGEEIRVSVGSHREITRISKDVDLQMTFGESVGIERFSHDTARLLFETLERRIRTGRGREEFYEAAFQEMIDGGTRMVAVNVGSFPVVEIDSPADLEHARQLVVPNIDSTPGVRIP